MQHRGDRVGGEHAHRRAGPQHAGDGGHRRRRRVDVLQDAVADDQVRGALSDQVVQAVRVALHGGQRDLPLGGPPLGAREGVGAGVHHGDVVAQRRERHREAAGAAADVHDVQRRPPGPCRGSATTPLQHVPDQRGPRPVTPALARVLPALRVAHAWNGPRGNFCGHWHTPPRRHRRSAHCSAAQPAGAACRRSRTLPTTLRIQVVTIC